jgi:hypothetical protein
MENWIEYRYRFWYRYRPKFMVSDWYRIETKKAGIAHHYWWHMIWWQNLSQMFRRSHCVPAHYVCKMTTIFKICQIPALPPGLYWSSNSPLTGCVFVFNFFRESILISYTAGFHEGRLFSYLQVDKNEEKTN